MDKSDQPHWMAAVAVVALAILALTGALWLVAAVDMSWPSHQIQKEFP